MTLTTSSRHFGPSRPWLAAAIGLLLPASLALASSCSWTQRTTAAGSYVSAGERIPLRISLDKLGVLPVDGVSAEQVAAAVMPHGLRPAGDVRGQWLLFRLERPVARGAIERLALELEALYPTTVEKAGLVVREPDAAEPMLVTNEVVVQFSADLTRTEVEAIVADNGAVIIEDNPFVANQYLVRLVAPGARGFLGGAERLDAEPTTEYAHPNFVMPIDYRDTVLSDALFSSQWHMRNTGQGGGTVDADADVSMAWDITQGSPTVVIAVLDDGFDVNHEDLSPNRWTNAAEIVNNLDDDANGLVDDVGGWDFRGDDNDPSPGASDNHGTAVAGVAAARGGNAIGVSGAAPNSRLLFIRNGSTAFDHGLAFNYAADRGASVVSNSWGYPVGTTIPTNVESAIADAANNGRDGLGAVVLFAMNNGNIDDCAGAAPDISSLPTVIAVSSTSNQDRKVTESAFGSCMDVLAPSHRGYGGSVPFSGTLHVTTTDRTGNAGYNNTSLVTACPAPNDPPNRNYTECFGGTSSATPLAAGVAALVLAARPSLTRLQVQRLLQDTSDKVQDSAAAYSTNTGFSTPPTGVASHGFGRINAFDAVRVAAPFAAGGDLGRGGVDLLIRDNRLDWGNTEQPSNMLYEPTRGYIPHWESVDIKVDAPPLRPAPTTSLEFDAFVDENPAAEQVNRVYVRVRNRGPVTATDVSVNLYWAFAGTALPALPTSFWAAFPTFPGGPSGWNPLGARPIASVPYSGASVAGSSTDQARIVGFDFPAPAVDPTQASPNHYCVMAIASSAADPVSPGSQSSLVVDQITPTDNNVTHRNLFLEDSNRDIAAPISFFIRNPTQWTMETRIRIIAPEDWRVIVRTGPAPGQSIVLAGGEERLVTLEVVPPRRGAAGEVTIVQDELDEGEPFGIVGGLTFHFAPSEALPDGPDDDPVVQ